jgi:hypothetical protein
VKCFTASVLGYGYDLIALIRRRTAIMRTSKELLSLSIVVRRVRVGSAPFGWEVHRVDTAGPIHVAPDRFRSMEAAYRAGQARLAEFIPKRSMPPGVTEKREWEESQIGFGVYDRRMNSQGSDAP